MPLYRCNHEGSESSFSLQFTHAGTAQGRLGSFPSLRDLYPLYFFQIEREELPAISSATQHHHIRPWLKIPTYHQQGLFKPFNIFLAKFHCLNLLNRRDSSVSKNHYSTPNNKYSHSIVNYRGGQSAPWPRSSPGTQLPVWLLPWGKDPSFWDGGAWPKWRRHCCQWHIVTARHVRGRLGTRTAQRGIANEEKAAVQLRKGEVERWNSWRVSAYQTEANSD
jgi:hypothetical protein